jgi:hypothetical protein
MTAINDLVAVLAKHPQLVTTNTPLEVLAQHMIASLQLFEDSLKERSNNPFFAPGRRNDAG